MRFLKTGKKAIDAFFDSSALLKRYLVDEHGAQRVLRFFADPANRTIVSELSRVEVIAALERALRTGHIATGLRDDIVRAFRAQRQDEYVQVRVGGEAIEVAERLVSHRLLRSLDAIQVASALTAKRQYMQLQFWTADSQQAEAAEAEGFEVVYLGA